MYVCIYCQTEKEKKQTMENRSKKTKEIKLKLMLNIYVINRIESFVFSSFFVYLRPV